MLGNTLKAPELLRNKGIRFETWKKWDKTAETLPSTGLKQYEPNNSWLQNKQIEKGLGDRKDLLGIERVERASQLAAAEWLPQQSRARVTKKSGQEWTSFGLEENLELYLFPEEALLLLELNCLELTWEGVALSIQQAYDVLLRSDRPQCSIDEYRVYSHLVRQGYRLQRFRYEDGTTPHDGCARPRRSSTLKRRKLIHDPLDGFGMTRDRLRVDAAGEPVEGPTTVIATGVLSDLRPVSKTTNDPCLDRVASVTTSAKSSIAQASGELGEDTTASGSEAIVGKRTEIVRDESGRTVERCPKFENRERIAGGEFGVIPGQVSESRGRSPENAGGTARKLPSEVYDNGVVNLPGPSNVEAKKIVKNNRDSKLQIISDETLVGDAKIISQWPGARIQRNVKWMPKRNTDEIPRPIVKKKIDGDSSRIEHTADKGAASLSANERSGIWDGITSPSGVAEDADDPAGRKRERTHEVIEVSDDEIEELPQRMSRIEMLNRFPNVISEPFLARQIPRRYLPPNVRPRKTSNRYVKWKVTNDKGEREHGAVYQVPRGAVGQIPYRNTVSSCLDFTPVPDANGTPVDWRNDIWRQGPRSHEGLYESRTTYQAASWAAQTNKGAFEERGHVAVQLGIHANVAVSQCVWAKSPFPRRGFLHRQNQWTNMSYYHSRQNLVNFVPRSACDRDSHSHSHRNSVRGFANTTRQRPWNGGPRRTWETSCDTDYSSLRTRMGESSFRIVPGAPSWAATKAKWLEEKTITIEDEDCTNAEDATADESEVKVVPRPLVGRRNATSLARVYKCLQIVKPATSWDFRRSRKVKQTDRYRISYNLYSTAQPFRKANPGTPAYRIAVFRLEDTPFIELADIARLQRDSKETPVILACVSQTSVTFAELGIVRIPDLPDNLCQR